MGKSRCTILPAFYGESWQGAVYTTKLTKAALDEHATSVGLTINLFQEYIPKAFEMCFIDKVLM